MAFNQQIRQSQKQAVTPLMMTGFSLLQLPIGELKEAVKQELEKNPALESARPLSTRSIGAAGNGAADYLENLADQRGETLDEHILSELRTDPSISPRELRLAEAIAVNLDGDGRFTATYADLIMVLSGEGISGVTERELEAMRTRVMALDPKGCGAKDLAECYRAQLGAIPAAKREAAARAVDELNLAIRENRLSSFRPSDLKSFMLLKALNPYPGRLYDRVRAEYITPDVVVDDEGNVEVDMRDIPALQISPKYIEMAKDYDLDEETRAYAAERVKKAREFRDALVHRQETVLIIAERTLARQEDFLKRGVAGLKKLTMSEIAKEAKCTVSTVSRAAARKYVKTPRGIFPLRRFFALVDAAPTEKLREILASLPAGAKITDRELSDKMAAAGFKMARRTISKYRNQLH